MDYETPDIMVRVDEQITIVRLKLETLTLQHDVARVTEWLTKIVDDDGARLLILDFKKVKQVSSATLGMMISLQKHVKQLGGRLVISHPEHIEELLRVSQTIRLFEIAPDSKSAFNLLKTP
jgi:anti-anti-sigma factor